MPARNKAVPAVPPPTSGSSLEDALRFDPFQDDFGAQGDRTLRDKIVKTRKSAECSHCGESIHAGQIVRSRTDIIDGDMMSWKWCHTCTDLMARAESKDVTIAMSAEDAYEARCRTNSD